MEIQTHINSNQDEAKAAILVVDKLDIKADIPRSKEDHFIMQNV